MKAILKGFTVKPLFNACAAMLELLHIQFNEVTRTPVPFASLYSTPLTKALQEVMTKVENTYFIGTVDEASLTGHVETKDAADVTYEASEGRYASMMIFAVNINMGESLTRTEMATLTRGFNRIAAAQPVILFIKYGHELALATCERSDYTQQWRDGEKLGKVSILRGINCEQPHRGHLDILESIGDKAYPTFEELYKHWMQVFSSELLTKKFYSELSDWYAWAVQVARFPNDLRTSDDDEKFNHESCIRLITRLIFVWFLKQKHLIPEEFFDERYIREHFIDEFNPHERKTLLYDAEQSKYYRLILQNLFFAMLNCPITAEGKEIPNNRRFRGDGQAGFKRDGYNVNNLMRYKADFKAGGADEFVQMANSYVPFLNGGLFDCLDEKPHFYYDGFSERKESLEQLYLPDWLFFGDEVGRSVDLSQWYGDTKKKKVSARGIIDILKRYNFTIEENTPLDQEVSLDPELLGKAFENLLASYNPETKTSARKQTGSFYTPREIVQYMVDESLIAHLKRTCGDELETEYRKLLSYSTDETTLDEKQRHQVMQALYNCRVLDPACGSGAFPMGVLQQMVHILRQLDPTNEMWKDFVIDLAIEQSRKAFSADAEEERKARLADIEEAFNQNINDPDYARKLYLIEHCIYGVDIQPIAVQISKLRFFISLVVDQKPTTDAAHNFGIRPLPNLESKFVAANTLIPVEYDGSLVESAPEVIKHKERLKELNHKIFLAKRNVDKQRLKAEIKETRKALAKAIEDTGFVGHSEAELLAGWDMFNQNASSSYFDAEWMFGVKGGFDIVIGNPPYVNISIMPDMHKLFKNYYSEIHTGYNDLMYYFICKGIYLLSNNGILSLITSNYYLGNDYAKKLRTFLNDKIELIINFHDAHIFESANIHTAISFASKKAKSNQLLIYTYRKDKVEKLVLNEDYSFCELRRESLSDCWLIANNDSSKIIDKIKVNTIAMGTITEIEQGSKSGKNKIFTVTKEFAHSNQFEIAVIRRNVKNSDIQKYFINDKGKVLIYTDNDTLINDFPHVFAYLQEHITELSARNEVAQGLYSWYRFDRPRRKNIFDAKEKIIVPYRAQHNRFAYDNRQCFNDGGDIRAIVVKENSGYSLKFLLGLLNSNLIDWYFGFIGKQKGKMREYFNKPLSLIPIPKNMCKQHIIVDLVDCILKAKEIDPSADIKDLEDKIDLLVYHLYGLTYDEVLIVDPETPITREEYEKLNK